MEAYTLDWQKGRLIQDRMQEADYRKISDKKIDDIEILEYNIDNTKETSISLRVKSSDEIAEYINYFIAYILLFV